ncbi:hypothetical protein [Glutamicibacter uratoxydans]|nr:hypothetical protein [Glutamicibacter uratoxydans]
MEVEIGGLTVDELKLRLSSAGVQLNDYAQLLMRHPLFERASDPKKITVRSYSVEELGVRTAATLPRIYEQAQGMGLELCPAVTGPYLRLAFMGQESSSNSILSAGRKPADSLTIASPSLGDDSYPKGFYLRAVDSVPWLRGYRCDDAYEFSAEDRFIFQAPILE